MPNQITDTGLQIKTVSEIVSDLTAAFQAIYGPDINVSPSSPDGQLINILAQLAVDHLELQASIYAMFSVASATGRTLDQRVALNGIFRVPGTYTLQPVVVTVSKAVTLAGLDDAINDPDGAGFTVADNAGTQFILAETHVFSGPGTETLSFRAKNIGKVETTPNTITTLVTIIAGVTSVNNPAAATSVGQDEESDLSLRIRHARIFKLASVGPSDAIEAALLVTDGVTDALVVENDTGSTDAQGIPANSIWAIAENGTDADVAAAIYKKKAPGCGMKGSVEVSVARPNGDTFTAKFDRPIAEDLYIKFSLLAKVEGATFDNDLIKAQLVAALSYKLNQRATIGDIYDALKTIVPEAIPTSVAVSKNDTDWYDVVSPTTWQKKFAVDVSRITIS